MEIKLSPKGWTFSEIDSGKQLGPEMVYNDLGTAWVSPTPLGPGSGLVIDLRQRRERKGASDRI